MIKYITAICFTLFGCGANDVESITQRNYDNTGKLITATYYYTNKEKIDCNGENGTNSYKIEGKTEADMKDHATILTCTPINNDNICSVYLNFKSSDSGFIYSEDGTVTIPVSHLGCDFESWWWVYLQ